MAIIQAREKKLFEIFDKEGYEFTIPSYQRPYAWGEEETEELFDSLYESFKNQEQMYFLGSIVIIKQDNSPHADVVDGQQRLTTLSILYSCLYNFLYDNGKKENILKTLKINANSYGDNENDTFRLKLRESDNQFFQEYISNTNINNLLNLPIEDIKREPQRNIKLNCEKIVNKIYEKFGNELYKQKLKEYEFQKCKVKVQIDPQKVDQEKLDKFIQNLQRNSYMVVVSVAEASAAFRIFSLMNSTGLDLLATDIIKSNIISKIEENEREKYAKKWENLENSITRNGFNDLFSHIRMVYLKRKAQKDLLEEFNISVLSNYDKKPTKFIDDLLEPYADEYKYLKNDYKDDNSKNKKYLMWLNKIDNSDWLPVALKYSVMFGDREDKQEEYTKFLRELETLSSYLYITAKDINQRIDRYSKILTEMEDNPSKSDLDSIKLRNEEKQVFLGYLNDDIYNKLVPKRRNYLILRLDYSMSTEEVVKDYNQMILTIEHVLPQTPDLEGEWRKIWTDQKDIDDWTNKLGNLIPLNRRANSAAKNWPFERKKKEYFMNKKHKTSTYALTTRVLNCLTPWNKDVVENNQKEYIRVLIGEWSL